MLLHPLLVRAEKREMLNSSSLERAHYLQTCFSSVPIQLIFWILQLESCDTNAAGAELGVVAKQFCNLPLSERVHKSYVLGVTLLHYLDVYSFMYKVCVAFES